MRFGVPLSVVSVMTLAVLIAPLQTSALTSSQVSRVAKNITVRIEGAEDSTGSGFIIEQAGSRYKILTCRHVVDSQQAYTVITPDQKRHSVSNVITQPFGENLDLAILEFTSRQPYSVATVGNSNQVESGQVAYVSGFPAQESGQGSPFILFNEGKINAKADSSLRNGYGLVYNISTLPGMSGGPVLDEQGHVIGVHGQGAQAEDITVLLEASQVNPGVVVKSGFNYAIPINTFTKLAAIAKVNLTQKTDLPSPSPLATAPKVVRPTTSANDLPTRPVVPAKPEAIAVKGIHDPHVLRSELSDNAVRFNQKYLDKIITVQGQVTGIHALPAPDQNQATVYLKSLTEQTSFGLPNRVSCAGLSASDVANLNRNDRLTIQGTYRGSSLYLFLNLEDCKIFRP